MSCTTGNTVRLSEDSPDGTVTRVSATVTVENVEDSSSPSERETEVALNAVEAPPTYVESIRRRRDNTPTIGRECVRKLLQTVIDSPVARYLLVIAALIFLIVVCDRLLVSQSSGNTSAIGDELRSLLSKKLAQPLQEGTGFVATAAP